MAVTKNTIPLIEKPLPILRLAGFLEPIENRIFLNLLVLGDDQQGPLTIMARMFFIYYSVKVTQHH